MPKLRLGVVGCGDIAGYMAWLSRLVPQVRLTACCDIDSRRAQVFARVHRIPQVFTSYDEMLADVDAVYLAVPHNLHYEMILAGVQRDRPVLVEKPLTRTLDEGVRLAAFCRSSDFSSDHKVGVNYQYRYDPGCYALARAVQSGNLGAVRSIRINIPWRRGPSYFDKSAWHKTIAQAGGGTLITQGSHLLDAVLWALGERPVSAVGYLATPGFDVEVDTLAHGILETSGGTLISITSSMVAAREQAVSVEVYGEKGTARYTNYPWPNVKFSGVRVRFERPPEWGVHPLQRSLAGFARWVLEDKPYLTPLESVLPVLAAVEAIYRSSRSGMREKVDDFSTG